MALTDEVFTAWADIEYNGKYYFIATLSGKLMTALDDQGEQLILPANASNYELGEALSKSLRASRIIPREEWNYFFSDERVDSAVENWLNKKCNHQGIKNKATLNKNMMYCRAEVSGENLYFEPWLHVSKNYIKRFSDRENYRFKITVTDNFSLIGIKLREAVMRCDGNGRMGLKFPEPKPD